MFKKLKNISLSILLIVILRLDGAEAVYKLQQRFSWTELDFAFPSESFKQQAISSGDYIPQNGLPVGIEHWGNKLFVSVPRWKDGIPATLTYINMDHTVTGSPELIPYPDWSSNAAGDCENGLSTVYRIKADECGRLWVLDTGTLGIGNTTENACPYALNVFDLNTNTRMRRYELRPDDTNPNTFIANIAIDIGKSCEDTFAYMSDELGYGLISYSWEQNKSWRFAHTYFFPDPLRGDFNVAGLNFQWGEEGIFGMALSPLKSDGYRTLYFSPLASHREFTVSTRILRDENRVEDSYHDFQYLDERAGNAHTTSRVMSNDGLMLFNLIDQNAVGCWHSSMPYAPQFHGVVDRDDVGLVFPADVKIDENQDVWVISDRMPVFLISELDYTDVNFRIYYAPLSSLIEGTICDKQATSRYIPANTKPLQQKEPLPPLQSSEPIQSLQQLQPLHPIHTIHSVQQVQPVHSIQTLQSLQPQHPLPSVSSPANPQPTLATKFLGSFPYDQARSVVFTTQRVPVAKAFVFNQHNGINYEAGSPHDYTINGLRNLQRSQKPSWWSRSNYH